MTLMQANRLEAQEKLLDAAEWTALVGAAPGFGLVQTWEFGRAKSEMGPWRLRHLLIEDAGRPVAAAQVMIRNVPLVRGGLAWVNRGPIFFNDPEPEPELLVGTLQALLQYWVKERGYYLRLAPSWMAGANDQIARDAGLEPAGRLGWASARLDLATPVDTLRAGLRKNWRSALAKAERDKIEVRSGDEEFRAFLNGYQNFLKERGFPTAVTPEFLAALQRLLPPDRKLRPFTAGPKDAPAAGVLIAHQGNTAEYLAAFRNADGNLRNAGQLLLWRAICDMRETGLRWFDLGGMDPLVTVPGILEFKEGTGATPYRLADELEASEGWTARLVRWRAHRS